MPDMATGGWSVMVKKSISNVSISRSFLLHIFPKMSQDGCVEMLFHSLSLSSVTFSSRRIFWMFKILDTLHTVCSTVYRYWQQNSTQIQLSIMQVTPLLNFDNQSLSSILLTVSPQNEVLMPQRLVSTAVLPNLKQKMMYAYSSWKSVNVNVKEQKLQRVQHKVTMHSDTVLQ